MIASRHRRLQRFPGLARLFVVCVLCGAYQAACGQKGPPLAPIVYLPRQVSAVTAKRVENEVVLQFTVPTVNTDNSGPADLRRVEVYAHTGPLPAPADFLKYGTLVASVDIKDPRTGTPASEEKRAEGKEPEPVAPKPGAADAARATAPVEEQSAKPDAAATAAPGMIEQGWTTSVRETLTPKHMEIGPMPPTRPVPAPDTPAVVVERLETPGTVNFDLAPQRYYTIVGVSRSRGRRGPYAGPIPVPLLTPLEAPGTVNATYTLDAISLNWSMPGETSAGATGAVAAAVATGGASATGPTGAAAAPGATGPAVGVMEAPDQETPGTVELYADLETEDTTEPRFPVAAGASKPAPPPAPRFGYNVYESGAMAATGASPAPDAPTAPTAPPLAAVAPVKPLNAALLTTTAFTDPRVEFGIQRCYVVRRVEMAGSIAIESAPSTPVCVTPVDTFPPAPPKSLAHIAGGNGVSLLWEANSEPDLGGYLVLRGEAPDDKLSPLTPAPISDTSFLDTTARRGRTYFYEVVAVDRSTPPNQSAPSNRVEETIR